MANSGFHDEPYDAGTLTKLKIFELYAQAWIPVFVSRPDPPFAEIHLYDLFCGPGSDSAGVPGSPLRLLNQLREYQRRGLPGWSKVRVVVHLSDKNVESIAQLTRRLDTPEWNISGVHIEKPQAITFQEALVLHQPTLADRRVAKLILIDQFGVDEVTDAVFRQLFTYPRTDFMFFLSSSTLHRFRDHPAIKIKIGEVDDSYDVHRVAADWFQALAPAGTFVGRFSIRKRSNIYGLIFGSQHPMGISKFLDVAWHNDEIAGEANFDIERENIVPGEMLLPIETFRPKKIQVFEGDLEAALRNGKMQNEADLVHFCIAAGMTCQHAALVLRKLKDTGVIDCDFRTPSVRHLNEPRAIRLVL